MIMPYVTSRPQNTAKTRVKCEKTNKLGNEQNEPFQKSHNAA